MSEKRSSTAFALSLASGLIILFGSMMYWLFFANFQNFPMGGMMGGGMWGMGSGFAWSWFFLLPLIAGIMVLVGAIMMYTRPQDTLVWGIIILVFSIIGFTGMGFSILGAILGIIGSIIALGEKNNR
jgi:hypothetical protein